jgi:hypothetical protein
MSFKLTVIINDSLSLGSVLMTKGVTAVHIETLPDTLMIEHKNISKNVKSQSIKDKILTRKQFHHPSGKTSNEFILEYIQERKELKWSEGQKYIQSLGFATSTLNNVITRLIEEKYIIRKSAGKYIINPDYQLQK